MNDNLRLLSIFHYVMGGLQMFVCSFPLIHVALGLGLVVAPEQIFNAHGDDIIPLRLFGGFFMVIGSLFVLAGWALAICTLLSGRYIAQRRKRMFSVVVGAIHCAHFPFGTALGVFTLILLTKDEAKVLYGEMPGPPPVPATVSPAPTPAPPTEPPPPSV